jgi:hypothetical protein
MQHHFPNAKQRANTWHKSTTMWNASWVHLIEKPMPTQHQKLNLMISRRLFLLIVELFPIPRKETIVLPPLQGLSHIQMLYLKQLSLTLPQPCKIIIVDCTSNHRLAIEIGWCSTTPISRYNRLCTFALTM